MYRYYVYMILCKDGTLYTGQTNDIRRRWFEHQKGFGSRYMRAKGFKKMVYVEEILDETLPSVRSLATRRERELKSWSRNMKQNLVKGNMESSNMIIRQALHCPFDEGEEVYYYGDNARYRGVKFVVLGIGESAGTVKVKKPKWAKAFRYFQQQDLHREKEQRGMPLTTYRR